MDKVEQIRDDLMKKNVFAVVVAALDEVACKLLMTWFFINMLNESTMFSLVPYYSAEIKVVFLKAAAMVMLEFRWQYYYYYYYYYYYM